MKKNTRLKTVVTSSMLTYLVSLSACSNVSATKVLSGSVAVGETTVGKVRFVVVDTMQESCFDNEGDSITCPASGESLYGQDAQHNGIQPSFSKNGDGTVTDNNTGLIWQQTPDYSQYSYDGAVSYCENLSVSEHSDWRLPTIKELYSISDFRGEIVDGRDRTKNTPYIDTDYFDFEYHPRAVYLGQYWSITRYVRGPVHNTQNVEAAFGFNFADGHIKGYETGYEFGTDSESIHAPGNFVRCVRGEANVYGVNQFVKNSDGTVFDAATGLMWLAADDGQRRNWTDALAYAESSNFAGYTDWRMPNIKELHSIVNYEGETGVWPAIDTEVFTLSGDNTIDDPMWVWSSTTQGDFKYTAAYIAFGKAFSRKNSNATEFYDWHGAGAQRSDPKSGTPADYDMASENATDLVMTKNYVILVRDAVTEK